MTALLKYQRLECFGLWRDAPEAQLREVLVNFREASLILADPKTESALSHWSLPAVERLNPGEFPALYAPGKDALETLELDDAEMIGALETVRGALAQARPRPGILRGSFLLGGMALVLVAGLVLLPDVLVEHTASVVPSATRAEIGRAALADLSRVTGAPCSDPAGQATLNALAAQLFGTAPPHLYILRDGPAKSVHLPGNIIGLHRALIETNDSGEVVAGYALAEAARAEIADPLIPLLDHAGLRATFGLLTTGALEAGAVQDYAETLLLEPQIAVPDEDLLARFAAASVPSTPYAYAVDPSGESVLGLIEADPFATGAPRAVLADGDWIALQSICAD